MSYLLIKTGIKQELAQLVTTKMDAHPVTPESGLVREENMIRFVRVIITHEMKPRMAEIPKPEVRKLIINLNMSHRRHKVIHFLWK